MADEIRLQKYFTDCGILSRRACEKEIAAGQVLVNGIPAKIGDKILPYRDKVTYHGKEILPKSTSEKHYILLNKPRGYVTTMQDEQGRKTVADLLCDLGTRVYPIGRLDMDSDGLLLFTDDGEFADRMMHPKFHVPKTYRVTFAKPISEKDLEKLNAPMELDGYPLRPVEIQVISQNVLRMTLHEGRNRQIRRMCDQAELKITRLQRISMGKIELGDLPLGKWRPLTENEIQSLKSESERNHPC